MSNGSLTNAENIAIRIARQQAEANKRLREKNVIDYYTAKRKAPKFERHYASTDITRFYE